jgi:nitrite reductase/ring-hydroxylating ferredoxin subunit
MAVYVAYGLLVLHVASGALQAEGSPVYLLLAFAGLATLTSLQLATGLRERRRDRGPAHDPDSAWIAIGCVDEIRDGRAKIVCPAGAERVAVFRQGTQLFAVTNVCAHQRGPLGEGKVVNGCITCPWHGWEYRPEDGRSPPPFDERIATYRLRVDGRQIWLDPCPLPPGTRVEPAHFEELHRDCDPPARFPD